ncbi:uncharacterized protein METZ01_LOCUS268719, partial [marine metagenome]
ASAPTLYYWCHHHASMGGIASTPAAVIVNKLLAYDGSGNLPAVDGSQITNVSTATSSASDPTISTNPSGGVGTEWQNTTSGEVYICTDATAGANVWTNIGAGSGDIVPFHAWGSNYGFASGGSQWPANTPVNIIEKYSFTSNGNATDHGDLFVTRHYVSGNSSTTHGYTTGGSTTSNSAASDVIDKFTFVSSGNATDVGDLNHVVFLTANQSSTTHGYVCGGDGSSNTPNYNNIRKFSFSSGTQNTSDIADLTQARSRFSGCSSTTHGYSVGGSISTSWTRYNIIDKFPFATDSNATDVGDLPATSSALTSTQSQTYGYNFGRYDASGVGGAGEDMIDKFSFSSDGNTSDVGDLTVGRTNASATASTTHGYCHGGYQSDGDPQYDVIDRVSFSSDGDATDVGDLSDIRTTLAGQQY